MHTVVEGLAALFLDIGGRVLTDTAAERIEVMGGRVRGVRVATRNGISRGQDQDGLDRWLHAQECRHHVRE